MARVWIFLIGPALSVACGGSVDISRSSGTTAPDASTTTLPGPGTKTVDGSTTLPPGAPDGTVCQEVHPTTPNGTCPVMPRSGLLCSSPASVDPCGGRGMCGYSIGPGIPERTCPAVVCTDDQGNCPPAESVCTPVETCTVSADCHGPLPTSACVACPLSPDGTQTLSCPHWNCTDGKCVAGAPCEERTGLSCPGGQGCPSYYFPVFDKACGVDADCAVFRHRESCCMTRVIGVSGRDKSRAEATEGDCNGVLDPFATICGCYSPDVAEDGHSTPQNGQEIVGACVDGACTAVVRGRIQCGSVLCAEGESCCNGADPQGYCTAFCAASCPAATGCTIPQ